MSTTTIAEVMTAWQAAYAAVDTMCSEFAALPGASKQYDALCKITREFQEAARAEIEAGIEAARLRA